MASVGYAVRTGPSADPFVQGEYYVVEARVDAVKCLVYDAHGTLHKAFNSDFRFGVEPPAETIKRNPHAEDRVKATKKIASTGGSTKYYDLPSGCKTLYDLIEQRPQGVMNFSEGNVFKAVWRMGSKEGIDDLYDWEKIKFCAEREIARLKKARAVQG